MSARYQDLHQSVTDSYFPSPVISPASHRKSSHQQTTHNIQHPLTQSPRSSTSSTSTSSYTPHPPIPPIKQSPSHPSLHQPPIIYPSTYPPYLSNISNLHPCITGTIPFAPIYHFRAKLALTVIVALGYVSIFGVIPETDFTIAFVSDIVCAFGVVVVVVVIILAIARS